ncbi:hypothetical protein [[Flexibacter] sp. ATCC 35208]|uniref:hypothetical protein n=1 Tax=[Flexibacter] sp. ATCC 35208 TaxID=1936242 RepID=UPI0009C63C35|nr:hypothetical protein [[Flexibacter] sp. ATCC 35208]OMP76196.1 hypothetical protein BW716_26320 [[Flexibacter] sp. ATCC 35208]
MKYDQEYVYTLLLRKQLGGLSDPEEEWIEKVFQETCKGKGGIAEFYEGLGNNSCISCFFYCTSQIACFK